MLNSQSLPVDRPATGAKIYNTNYPGRARPDHYGDDQCRRDEERTGDHALLTGWPRAGAGCNRERGDEELELEHLDLKTPCRMKPPINRNPYCY